MIAVDGGDGGKTVDSVEDVGVNAVEADGFTTGIGVVDTNGTTGVE